MAMKQYYTLDILCTIRLSDISLQLEFIDYRQQQGEFIRINVISGDY